MIRLRFYHNTINGCLWVTYTRGTSVYRRFGRLRGKVECPGTAFRVASSLRATVPQPTPAQQTQKL